MVLRRVRTTGEPFLGCSTYPACRGTRPVSGSSPSAAPRSTRARAPLSDGGRHAKSLPDVVELLVARRLGRTLKPWEGCLVQGAALLIFLAIVYWFFVSGMFYTVTKPIVEWYVHQIHFGPAATPSPSA